MHANVGVGGCAAEVGGASSLPQLEAPPPIHDHAPHVYKRNSDERHRQDFIVIGVVGVHKQVVVKRSPSKGCLEDLPQP